MNPFTILELLVEVVGDVLNPSPRRETKREKRRFLFWYFLFFFLCAAMVVWTIYSLYFSK